MKNVTLRFFRNLNSGGTTKKISVANNWIKRQKDLVVAFCTVEGRPIISAPILEFRNVKSSTPVFHTRANSTYKIVNTVNKRCKVKTVTFVNRKGYIVSSNLDDAQKWLQEDGDVYCEEVSLNVVDVDPKRRTFEVEDGRTIEVECDKK